MSGNSFDSLFLLGTNENSSRLLYDSANRGMQSSNGAVEKESFAFFMFVAAIVSVIGVCYLYCMIQMIRLWCCRRDTEAAVLITDGITFSLNSAQRRAVLETIFSDTSKVSQSVTIKALFLYQV